MAILNLLAMHIIHILPYLIVSIFTFNSLIFLEFRFSGVYWLVSCYVTNYYKSVAWCNIHLSHSLHGSGGQPCLNWVLYSGSHKVEIGVSQAVIPCRIWVLFQDYMVVGRIYFLTMPRVPLNFERHLPWPPRDRLTTGRFASSRATEDTNIKSSIKALNWLGQAHPRQFLFWLI